ncbi:MAG: hypothetical protein O3B41_10165 [Bacteroidetes bacterium]|nr:hypothetical protein [Bacteroidota bacterium]
MIISIILIPFWVTRFTSDVERPTVRETESATKVISDSNLPLAIEAALNLKGRLLVKVEVGLDWQPITKVTNNVIESAFNIEVGE